MSSSQVFNLAIEPGQYLSKPRLASLLANVTPPDNVPSSALYLRPGEAGRFLATAGPEAQAWAEHLSQLGEVALKSDTGVAGLRSGDEALIIIPPFPVLEDRLFPFWSAAPLLELLAAEYIIGVVLLRLGRYSVAIYQGEKLLSSKTDSRYVKGRHRAGGSSQRRFERIREGQMRRIYDKTCEAVEAQFGPYSRQLYYVVLGGEHITLNSFRKVCPYLEQHQGIILGRRLNVRDPKRDTLEQVGHLLWESRVYPVEW